MVRHARSQTKRFVEQSRWTNDVIFERADILYSEEQVLSSDELKKKGWKNFDSL